ncbi:MAG: hypothetical protein EHM12_01735 [Dehalococcoidia bacterium]|nr:MAG: hypothetical protein EHM12_01735 [Dehalococcoidia bacterium]
MQVDFAFICDYADASNKINALGIGFDTIMAQKAPVKHPSFFLVIQMRATIVEAGEKNFEVHLIDDDGREIVPSLKGKINIPRPPAGTENTGRIAMRYDNIEFPNFGSYSIHIVVEGHEMVRIPLRVAQAPGPVTQ